MEYWLDVLLCGLITIGELIGVIILAMAIQLIFYRVFKIKRISRYCSAKDTCRTKTIS